MLRRISAFFRLSVTRMYMGTLPVLTDVFCAFGKNKMDNFIALIFGETRYFCWWNIWEPKTEKNEMNRGGPKHKPL